MAKYNILFAMYIDCQAVKALVNIIIVIDPTSETVDYSVLHRFSQRLTINYANLLKLDIIQRY